MEGEGGWWMAGERERDEGGVVEGRERERGWREKGREGRWCKRRGGREGMMQMEKNANPSLTSHHQYYFSQVKCDTP